MNQVIYSISDSAGDITAQFAKMIFAQFPKTSPVYRRFSFLKNDKQLSNILLEADKEDAIIFHTLNSQKYCTIIDEFCKETNLIHFDLLNPYINRVEHHLRQTATHEVGAAHKLNSKYFNRIDAIDFAAENDDGQNPRSMLEADVVILGISRTSKTPLTFYLANQGIKVMNYPLVPHGNIPEELWRINPHKIVGLTTSKEILKKVREQRMLSYGLKAKTTYSDTTEIQDELDYANNLYKKLGCLVISTADKSIEEVAAIIIDKFHLNNQFD